MEIYENLSLEDMEGEIWKDIEGYEGNYKVSNLGRVKSIKRNKIMKASFDKDGYLRITLSKNGIRNCYAVHILVARNFMINYLNKPTIDHINTIKTDNRVENLRFFTYKEQTNNNPITSERQKSKASITGKKNIQKAIDANKKKVRCITTGKEFDCARDGVRYYNLPSNNIIACCRGKIKYSGKLPDGTRLVWGYVNEN